MIITAYGPYECGQGNGFKEPQMTDTIRSVKVYIEVYEALPLVAIEFVPTRLAKAQKSKNCWWNCLKRRRSLGLELVVLEALPLVTIDSVFACCQNIDVRKIVIYL